MFVHTVTKPSEHIPVRSCARGSEGEYVHSDVKPTNLTPAKSPPYNNREHHLTPKREVIYEGIHCSLLTREEKSRRNKEIHESMIKGNKDAHETSDPLSDMDSICSDHNHKKPQLSKLGTETSVQAMGSKGGGG